MRGDTWLGVLAVGLWLAACGPKEATTGEESGSSTTTLLDTTAAPTSTTTSVDACGLPPGPLTCEGIPPDPRTLECEARPQASCDGPLGDWNDECAWVQLSVFTQEAEACGGAVVAERCIALGYQGDGCQVPGGCAGASSSTTYYRVDDECAIEVMQGSFCETQPVGWRRCDWPEASIQGCALAWPRNGPSACNCAC